MIDACSTCGYVLYAEKEKTRQKTWAGSYVVDCADSEACRVRYDDARRAKRDIEEDQRLSAGQKSRSYYI